MPPAPFLKKGSTVTLSDGRTYQTRRAVSVELIEYRGDDAGGPYAVKLGRGFLGAYWVTTPPTEAAEIVMVDFADIVFPDGVNPLALAPPPELAAPPMEFSDLRRYCEQYGDSILIRDRATDGEDYTDTTFAKLPSARKEYWLKEWHDANSLKGAGILPHRRRPRLATVIELAAPAAPPETARQPGAVLSEERIAELIRLVTQELKGRPNVQFELTPIDCLTLIGHLQLALRHPENTGPMCGFRPDGQMKKENSRHEFFTYPTESEAHNEKEPEAPPLRPQQTERPGAAPPIGRRAREDRPPEIAAGPRVRPAAGRSRHSTRR